MCHLIGISVPEKKETPSNQLTYLKNLIIIISKLTYLKNTSIIENKEPVCLTIIDIL